MRLHSMKRLVLIILMVTALAGIPAISSGTTVSASRQEIASVEPTVAGCRGAIEFSCPPNGRTYNFLVYSITGQLLKRIPLSDTISRVEFPQGCYIIKCEAWVKKVIVI